MAIWREKGQKSKIKKFRTCGSLWVITFCPCINNILCINVCYLLFLVHKWKVSKKFHLLNVHFTTHGQDPPKKRAKNPMAMGITKFNLGFKSTSTGEWGKTMDDSVFFSILSCN
jgi:hypothetical protein